MGAILIVLAVTFSILGLLGWMDTPAEAKRRQAREARALSREYAATYLRLEREHRGEEADACGRLALLYDRLAVQLEKAAEAEGKR